MYGEIQPHTEYLQKLACSYTNDANEASGLFQETLVKALTKFHQFNTGTNLKAWMLTIMRNAYINQYRKNKRRRAYSLEDTITDAYSLTENNHSESNMMTEEIMKQLSTLRPTYKSLLEMIMEGYQYDQIAKYYRFPLGTVKSHIHLARKELAYKPQRV